MSIQLEKRLFTVNEYHKMVEAGILSEDDRVELLDGEIIKMNPIGSYHAGRVNRLNTLFNARLGQAVIVSIQNPIQTDEYSEPQPDLTILKFREDFYTNSHPTQEDILLLIEVSDTSVVYDRDVKIPKYAQSLITEAWILNIPDEILEVYLNPTNGKYQNIKYFHRGQSLSPKNIPDLVLSVDELLG
jgi:Uma2 family endonuclease